LQDLRRLKYTKHLFRKVDESTQMYNQSPIQPKVRMCRSVRDIHLRRILLPFGHLFAVVAITAAAAIAAAAAI
jgi:hypothetical protein